MNFVQIEDYRLNYTYINQNENKDEPLIIFLHEALGSITQWKDFPELLCKKTGLEGLVYERRGHGHSSALSEKRKANYLHEYARVELPALLEQLDEKRDLILFGHSDGGSIALLYSSLFRERVIGQIVLAAHAFVEEITLNGVRPMNKVFETTSLQQKLKKHHFENTSSIFYAWYNIWLSKEFRNWNIVDELSTIDCPSLILQGEDDQYGSVKQVEEIYKNISGVKEKEILSECGHAPHLEAKTTTLNRSLRFLKEHVLN